MQIKEIVFLTPLEEIEDIYDDDIDVFVTLEDEFAYSLQIATPKSLLTDMNNNGSNFIGPGYPIICVRKLTLEIITQAIEAYAYENAYWLKLYHFAGHINRLDDQIFERLKEAQELDESEVL